MFDVLYNNISGNSIGVLCKRRPDIPAPILTQEEYTVPGRDGVLLSAIKRYEPIDIPVEFNFMAERADHWGHVYRQMKRWLRGGGTLRFSDDDEVFFKAYKAEILTTERSSYRIGSADVSFRCDPYTYFTNGESYYTTDACERNDYELALPVYHITGNGEWVMLVNGNGFSGNGEAYIDTEKQVTTDGSGNIINTVVTGDYEELFLQPGENTFQINGAAVRIKPRWRTV